jgi:hypothetical protein
MNAPSTAASVSLLAGVQGRGSGQLPRCLALPPVFGQLLTREGIGIRPLNDDGTLGDQAELIQFQAVDGEPWVQRFLGDLDRFVSAPFASAMCGQPEWRDALVRAIGCTLTMAEAIAAELQPVFSSGDDSADAEHSASDANGLASARGVLKRLLCQGLLAGYRSAVLVQYEAQVNLPWTGTPGLAPRALHGPARLDADGATLRFSTARTGLADGDRFATFVAEVDEPARHRWVGGPLQYTCTHAEFALAAVDVPPGCEAADGPSIVPLQGADGGPAALQPSYPHGLRLPVPLRSFPAQPSILAQQALPTHARPASLDELPLWTYALTFSHAFAAQDTVKLWVDIDQPTPAAQRAAASPASDTLFDTLAQYIAVADRLWALMAPPADPQGLASAVASGVNAARTFVALACAVAQQWSARRPPVVSVVALPDRNAADKCSLAFEARATFSKDGKTLESIALTRGQTAPGPSDAWPAMDLVLDGGSVVLEPQTATRDTVVYRPPTGTAVPALGRLTLRLAWKDIQVCAHQCALARIQAVRNAQLLYDPQHAGDPAWPTHPRLLLTTAEVRSVSAVTPQIPCGDPLEISGVDVKTALASAVQTLCPAASASTYLTASWQVHYEYALTADGLAEAGGLRGKLPVLLCPARALDGVADALAAAVQAWVDEHHPPSSGVGWLFEVTLFSGLEPETQALFRAALRYRPG